MGLPEIISAIQELSEQELCELNAFLQKWKSDPWDEQMQQDAIAGERDVLVREAEEAYQRGDAVRFP
ncbi:MAG: hypothetical protein ACR2IE_10910 [Candidatus Sumerlaeaceae bacterium]